MPATYAVERTLGRRHPETPHPYRNDFQRDRDRVIHSRAFRRLEAKTQVFTRRYSDHFRNRLTHTIEVAQISRTIAAQLGLNVDLVEALALVHDIGHPPFGHAGERTLDAVMRQHGFFFDHNLHALRIVEDFELRYAAFRGLNLTFEVREGIIKHSHDYSAAEFPELAEYLLDQRPPLEAQLIDITDELAYSTADLDDGFEARLLTLEDLVAGVPLFARLFDEVQTLFPDAPKKLQFNEVLRRILNRWVTDLIQYTRTRIDSVRGADTPVRVVDSSARVEDPSQPSASAVSGESHSREITSESEEEQLTGEAAKQRRNAAHGASRGSAQQGSTALERPKKHDEAAIDVPITLADIRIHPHRLASLSPEAEVERRQTKEFLYKNLYYSPALEPEKEAAERIITDLFELWMKHPEKLPSSYQDKAESQPLARVVCDYIAGMTDPYIYEQHEKHCG